MTNRLKFSKTTLEALALPSAGKRATYYDSEVPKLAVRVTSSGAKSFYVIKRNLAEMVWLKLGVFPDLTVENARKQAQSVIGEFSNGLDPAAVRRATKAEPTVGAFFTDEYTKRHGARQRSWRDIKQRYRDYLERPIGSRKLSAVTREMISRILSDMDSAGKAGSTVNNVRALISSIYSKAIEWGFAADNPVKGTKTRKTVKRDRFLQSDELPRFFSALACEPNDVVRDYFLIALLTGARRANVLAMRWDELRLDEGIWRISRTKNGDPQNVTLSPEAIAILLMRKKRDDAKGEKSPFVFPGTGESGHLVEPKAGWKRIFDNDELSQLVQRIEAAGHRVESEERAKSDAEIIEGLAAKLARARARHAELKLQLDGSIRMPDLRIHDLRRTLGSWQAKTGASLAVIGKSLNHKNTATTAIYARLDLDPVRQSVNAATSAMFQAGGVKLTPDIK